MSIICLDAAPLQWQVDRKEANLQRMLSFVP